MVKVTAKTIVWSKYPVTDSMTHVTFGPDYADGANRAWAEATPGLNFTMTMKNEVAEQFAVQGHYTVTFEE